MPFTSQKQLKKCFALKAQGKAGSWDCDKWAKMTGSVKDLPMTAAQQHKKHFGKSDSIVHK